MTDDAGNGTDTGVIPEETGDPQDNETTDNSTSGNATSGGNTTSGQTGNQTGGGDTNSTSTGETEVSITTGSSTKTDNAFEPNPISVSVGDTVTWTNDDTTVHTATSGTAEDGPTGMFGGTLEQLELLAPSQSQSFTFEEAGEYPYYCTLHPSMVGSVSVS
jgi:plastocyanin